MTRGPRLFGTQTRTAILVALRLLEASYASELAALLGAGLFNVQRVLASLEAEGVVACRSIGRTRQVTLNPCYFAHAQLAALLWELGVHNDGLQRALAARRRRPRRAGKPGL